MVLMDFIIIGIALIYLLFGLKKGFFKQLMGFAAILLAVLGARLLTPVTADFVATTPLNQTIDDKIVNWLEAKEGIFTTVVSSDPTTEQIEEAMTETGLPGFIVNAIAKYFNLEVAEGETKTFAELLSPEITRVIVVVISFIALILILWLAFFILAKILNKIFSFGVLGLLNRILGGGLGLIKALLVISLVFLGLSALSGLVPQINTFLTGQLENAGSISVFKILNDNNPINWLINSVFKI